MAVGIGGEIADWPAARPADFATAEEAFFTHGAPFFAVAVVEAAARRHAGHLLRAAEKDGFVGDLYARVCFVGAEE